MKFKSAFNLFMLACCLMVAPIILITSSCSTPQQRVAYNTIASVEATASAAVDGYYSAVIKGIAPTNEVPQVSKAFNQLQAAATLAATLDQAGTNAIAPQALNNELGQLLSLVSTLVPNK